MRRCCFALLAILTLPVPLLAQARTADAQVDSLVRVGRQWLATYNTTKSLADARKAHAAFTAALKRVPNHADASLGLGLTYAAVELQQLDPLGLNEATRPTNNYMAVRYLTAAVRNGANLAEAAEALKLVASREYKKEQYADLFEVLESVKPSDERSRIALAEMYILAYRQHDAAALLANATTPAGKRVAGIAELLNAGTRQQGAQKYWSALSSADSAQLQKFMLDARWLADSSEANIWKRLSPADLRERLLNFWARRAVVSAVSLPDRLATHFTRVQTALDRFNFYDQRSPVGAPSPKTIEFGIDNRLYFVDDRAFVYVRYGEPDQTIRTGGDYLYNESWIYRRLAEHPVSFDFFLLSPQNSSTMTPRGWTLVYDIPRCTRNSALPYNEDYLRDRQALDHRYAAVLQHCSSAGADQASVDAAAAPLSAEKLEFLTTAIVRDNAIPPTTRNIPLLTDVVQFRGRGAATNVTAVVAWSFNSFVPIQEGSQNAYRVRLSFFIADTLGGTIGQRDTTIVARIPAANTGSSARVHLSVEVPSARAALYRIGVQDLNSSDSHSIVGDTIEVRSHAVTNLHLSDIAMAATAEGGSWQRRGHALSLLPRGAALRNFRIYYEIYNLPRQAAYQTRVSFIPQDDALAKVLAKVKGSRVVSFEFSGSNETAETTVSELRALSTELPAGTYTLRIAVTAGGATAQQDRTIRVP